MLDELVALQPDEPLIGNLSPKSPVLDCSIEALVKMLQEYLPALIVQQAAVEVFFEMVLCQHPFVQQFENHPVADEGFEYLACVIG